MAEVGYRAETTVDTLRLVGTQHKAARDNSPRRAPMVGDQLG